MVLLWFWEGVFGFFGFCGFLRLLVICGMSPHDTPIWDVNVVLLSLSFADYACGQNCMALNDFKKFAIPTLYRVMLLI